jgi:hypothetical protein
LARGTGDRFVLAERKWAIIATMMGQRSKAGRHDEREGLREREINGLHVGLQLYKPGARRPPCGEGNRAVGKEAGRETAMEIERNRTLQA